MWPRKCITAMFLLILIFSSKEPNHYGFSSSKKDSCMLLWMAKLKNSSGLVTASDKLLCFIKPQEHSLSKPVRVAVFGALIEILFEKQFNKSSSRSTSKIRHF